MTRYAAFLRAVNLGATRKAPSGMLRAVFEELGFDEVATYQTSGNVIFAAQGETGEEALCRRIEAALADALGFDVPVFLRGERKLRAIASHEPFDPGAVERSKGKLQVDLLQGVPSAAARTRVLAMAGGDDLLSVRGTELYWLPAGGLLDSELDLDAITKLVGPGTRRTMGTIERIAAKFFDR
jgi:uncharacterized protein (DUF1697 family)